MFLKFLLLFSVGCATASLVLKNNTNSYTLWQKLPVKPLIKVYLFNYTNWEEVKNGTAEKLHVEEVGPYVYTQQIERVNVQFKGDLLEYQEKRTWTFLPEKSTGSLFDEVNVPNLPLLGISSMANKFNLSYFALFALNQAVSLGNHPEAFVKLPVNRFLWGYYDTIINTVKPVLGIQENKNIDQFGLLAMENGTSSDRLVINTGAIDINKINVIEQLNGADHMNYWGNPVCNSVAGSDGRIFPISWLDRNTTLHVLFPNLCRRLPFVYQKDIELENQVKLLRYILPMNVFGDLETNPHNQCYCEIETGICPPRGLINITACNEGLFYPAMVSFPHFYFGDHHLRENVTGLKPDPLKHESYLDVHPTLGISLNRKSAFQLNVQVNKVPALTSLGFLKQDMVLPIAWFDMIEQETLENIQMLVNNENSDSETGEPKQPNFEEYITNEVREMRKQMSDMMILLSTLNKTQSEFVNQMTENITAMRNKINNISTKVDLASIH